MIEGVMMGGRHTTVTAIRRKDGTLEYYEVRKEQKPLINALKKIPFVRGIVGILDSSILGTKHLNFASEKYDVDPADDTDHIEDTVEEKGKWAMILGVSVLAVLSFLFGKFILTLVPTFLAEALTFIFPGYVAQILLEGFFKLLLIFGYIYFISLTPMVKRLFQYHGAEHKVINTFENDQLLTVENVKKNSRLHYRCGSSFILFTAVISIFLYFLVPIHPLWLRVVSRILLIPVDLGIAYEVLQGTNKLRGIPVLRWLGYPGLWLQLLTTKEPDAEQIEVAIAAFNEMKDRENGYIKEKHSVIS
ncbi:membrane protein [Pullulanibacillus pueri]|uniref:Membrane protein n=2 Tax=Pullulanibacillus pueri TaxID=1437324 RepID=A0A8J3EL48_9BACL|nr:membrane protein [Pullulanibacillus pueri]